MVLGVAALALLPGCATPAPEAAEHRLELAGNRLFVPVTVNGQAATALLDSGAEMTIVDDDLAAQLGLALAGSEQAKGSGGTVAARFADDVDIAAAGVSLADRKVAVIDLEDVSTRLVGRPVAMILGRDLFDAARLRIDVSRGGLAAVAREAQPAGTRLTLTTHKGIEHFPASVEGHAPVLAAFDLGNGSEVLIGKAYAERIGLTAPGRIVARKSGGGLGGAIDRDVVRLETLSFAGRTFRDVPAAIDPVDSASDLNIGTALLREFAITVDYGERALWLEPK